MPAKSGASHTLAAVVALLLTPLVRELWLSIVDGENIRDAVDAASTVVADHPYIPAGEETVAVALTILTLVVLIYIWGHVYHVKRHSS